MNERIRQLVEKSYIYDKQNDSSFFNKELFAELIVKKCMDVAKYHTPETEECEYTWLIHDKIKQYFGVEE
jgi:hypothetical protein